MASFQSEENRESNERDIKESRGGVIMATIKRQVTEEPEKLEGVPSAIDLFIFSRYKPRRSVSRSTR